MAATRGGSTHRAAFFRAEASQLLVYIEELGAPSSRNAAAVPARRAIHWRDEKRPPDAFNHAKVGARASQRWRRCGQRGLGGFSEG
jgi:hypothetical protein